MRLQSKGLGYRLLAAMAVRHGLAAGGGGARVLSWSEKNTKAGRATWGVYPACALTAEDDCPAAEPANWQAAPSLPNRHWSLGGLLSPRPAVHGRCKV